MSSGAWSTWKLSTPMRSKLLVCAQPRSARPCATSRRSAASRAVAPRAQRSSSAMRRRPPDSCATRSMKKRDRRARARRPSGSALAMCSTRACCDAPPPHPARPRAATAATQAHLMPRLDRAADDGDRRPGIGRAADPQPAAQRLDAVGEPAQPGAEPRVSATDAVVGDRDVENRAVALDVAAHTRGVRVLGDVGERFGAHEVGGRLDAGRKPSVGRGRRPPAPERAGRALPARPRGRGRRARADGCRGRARAAPRAPARARRRRGRAARAARRGRRRGLPVRPRRRPRGVARRCRAAGGQRVGVARRAAATMRSREARSSASRAEPSARSRSLASIKPAASANSDDELLVVEQRLVVHEGGDALAVALDGGRRAPRPGPRQRERAAVEIDVAARRRAASSRWSGSGR